MTDSQEIALPDDYLSGLEDFDSSNITLPRLNIQHADGVFLDKQSLEEFPRVYGFFLGMVRQRVMWAQKVEPDSLPLCKSNDAETGYPNVSGPRHSLFPWAKAGMDPASAATDEHGRPVIKCESCPFAQWGREDGKSVPPLCSERYTMPMYYSTEPLESGREPDRAALISFQRSGITPLKNYMSVFKRLKQPLFSANFEMWLDLKQRGTVNYSTPKIKKLTESPSQDRWADYAEEYRTIREALRRAPTYQGDDDSESSDNSWNAGAKASQPVTQQASQPVARQASPVTQAAPPVAGPDLIDAVVIGQSSSADDDDLPF